MVSDEQKVAMQLPSPTMKQPTVSDQSLSMSMTHISPSRHRSKTGRSRRKNSGRSFPLLNMRAYDINSNTSKTISPYYKGLTDQSLAIVDTINPCHAPPTHIPTDLLSSPYYKGLTDYSKVIDPWTPRTHHIHVPPTTSFSYPCSPYYRGLLTDYSLVLHAPPLEPPTQPPITHPNSSIKSLELVMDKLSAADTCSSLSKVINTDFSLKDLIVLADHDSLFQQLMSMRENNAPLQEAADEETTLEEVELIDEEKPLREKESAEAIEDVSVLEDESDKMILEEMELIAKGPHEDVEMVIEEKPLREIVFEQANDKVEEMKFMSGDVIEEKPLRETVSETCNVIEMDAGKVEEIKDYEKEKALFVSKPTVVASESQCEKGGNVYEYTWETIYQPTTLEEFICNKDMALQLKAMVKKGCGCSHFIFEGPPCVGKRSMIRAMLREVFGGDKMQGEMVDKLQVHMKKSVHHVEMNLSETKGYEKHVIVELFKEAYGQIINNSEPCCPENCKAIILYEAEKLSMESLLYIKWLLEKYKGCNKVFFCCSDESRLQPVKPLCITVRLSSPSSQELERCLIRFLSEQLVKILEHIGKEEGIKLSRDIVEKIILRSNNNLRQAIRSLEATCRNK
ncbi:hypothetical protein Fmac_000024 [Flemingia macrophylla]|uniref:Uncharacterized protein n=1 Tax=Flemingia macrophylla TaxID=520843 RepID=A0ABD1ND39_9FABA